MASAVSPLVSVPRKTTSDVDYSSAIKQVISTTYGEAPDRYTEEIANLNRARQDAVRGAAGSDMTARDLLYRYFGQLELLELRFPDLRVPFPWNDAFTPAKSISQLSLAYEKASVIFNIAATLSALAAAQNRSSPEGLKRAFNFYRSSAGMFTYINDNFLHAPSTDLGRDLIKVLVALMTAQATEVFLERMNEEKRSPGLKSKICAQVAAVYAGMVEDVKENVSKGYFDRSWLVIAQTKSKYFASLAQYNRSLADTAASKHGDALARLTIADTNIKEAVRLSLTYGTSFYINAAASAASTLPVDAGQTLQEMCKNHATVVSEAKNAAQKDNDLIYHAIVPSEASLPVIEKAANVAEPIPIQEIYATPEVQKLVGQDIFVKLVPLSVIESSSLYSEEKAKILRTEGERCDVADGELQALLDHLGLPGNLAKFRARGAAGGAGNSDPLATMADPGGQVRAWSREIKDSESYKRTDAYITELSSLRDKANADLDHCSRELDTEQRECEQARVKYDYLFEQSPSASHTKSWRTDIKNDREALQQARASDDQVLSLWSSVRDDVNALAAGDQVIEGIFSDTIARVEHSSGNSGQGRDLLDLELPDDEGDEMNRRIATIQEALSRLSKLKKERSDVIADLKERVHNDDISQLLILNRKSQNVEPTLFAAELEKFRPHQARIQATIAMQQSTLQQVQDVYAQLTSGKKGKEIQDRFVKIERAKKDLVARYKRAHDSYLEIRTGITKGAEFYRNLVQMVGTLRGEVSQFVSARASERSQMLSQAEMRQRLTSTSTPTPSDGLDRSFGSMSLGQPSSPRSLAGQNQSHIPPARAFSGSNYPSVPGSQPGQSAQPSYSPYSGPPPPRPPVTTSSYSSGPGSAYPSSSTPSLPPKPSTQSNPGPAQYRQPSSSGLPPPPGQPHYSSHAPSAMPPPPTGLSYNSYPSPPSAHASYRPASSALSNYGSPPPPPPQHPSHTGYSSYSQPPSGANRPPPQIPPSHPIYAPTPPQPGNYSSYTSQASTQPSQQQYQQSSYTPQSQAPYGQPQYGLPPGQQQHQPPQHASQYGYQPSPQHQSQQYSGQPQQQQPRY